MFRRGCILLASLLLLLAMPGMAVVQESCYLGRITSLDPLSNTLVIRAESQYTCDYSDGSPFCSFIPITPLQIAGNVPSEGIYTIFRNGDHVVATIPGGSGGGWNGIALVSQATGTKQWQATEIYGDPNTLPVTLAGGYRMDYAVLPDCSRCNGSVCKVLSAHVRVWSGEVSVVEEFLNVGHSLMYPGRNDGSSVSIFYLSGEAGADQCSQAGAVTGIQPISSFIIHVVPPIGQPGTPQIMTQPTAEGIKPEGTPPSTPVPTRASSGYLLSIGALVTIALGLRW